jgi:hypothetical protein
MANWADAPSPSSSEWHRCFGGLEWRHDASGVFVREDGVEEGPLRTQGRPLTAEAIVARFGAILIRQSVELEIPPEIVIMTIATEAAYYRSVGFTGPATFRWEAHVKVTDSPPDFRGDYSLARVYCAAVRSAAQATLRQRDQTDPSVYTKGGRRGTIA